MKKRKLPFTPLRAAALLALVLFTAVESWADDLPAVKYIDADGIERECDNYTTLIGSTSIASLSSGWYVVDGNVSFSGQLHFSGGDVNLILCDDMTLTVNSGSTDALLVDGNLTIYGQSGGSGALRVKNIYNPTIRANNTGNNATDGNITINGGRIYAYSNYSYGISAARLITINGGNIETVSDHVAGIYAHAIHLSWCDATNRIKANGYEVLSNASFSEIPSVISASKPFTDGDGHIYTGTLTTEAISAIANTELIGTDLLYDKGTEAAENTTRINTLAAANNGQGKHTNITLSGRTLYKDGKWNTLCLPFDVTIAGSVLDGATVKKLTASESGVSGTTLTLNFEDEPTTMTAGTPYIIKWANGDNLVNPVFTGVTVKSATNNISFTEGSGSFNGTYTSTTYDAATPNILFMGKGNTLYYPEAGATIGAFRAYFRIGDSSGAPVLTAFILNFGDGTATGVPPLLSPEGEEGASPRGGLVGVWYTLSGTRLTQQPTQKGVYIHNGKKVVMK